MSEEARDLVAVHPEEMEANALREAARCVAKIGSSMRCFQALVLSESGLSIALEDLERFRMHAQTAAQEAPKACDDANSPRSAVYVARLCELVARAAVLLPRDDPRYVEIKDTLRGLLLGVRRRLGEIDEALNELPEPELEA